jgi:hypothetical protein
MAKSAATRGRMTRRRSARAVLPSFPSGRSCVPPDASPRPSRCVGTSVIASSAAVVHSEARTPQRETRAPASSAPTEYPAVPHARTAPKG